MTSALRINVRKGMRYMRRYDEQVLNALLDRYERSLLYDNRNQVNIVIDMKINKSTLPAYFDESSLQYDVIHEQLTEIETRGLIRLVWKGGRTGHILDRCVLNVERSGEAYRRLGRTPRRVKEEKILAICRRWKADDGSGKSTGTERIGYGTEDSGALRPLSSFLRWVEERILSGETVSRYVDIDHPEDLERLCTLLQAILENTEECYLRRFSIRVFHDSKIAEKEIRKAAEVIREFGSRNHNAPGSGDGGTEHTVIPAELEADQILEEYGVYRNPVILMVKGRGRFCMEAPDSSICHEGVSSGVIDLSLFHGGIGITPKDAAAIRWETAPVPERVITIENLTSFHQWKQSEGELVFYLGGYASRSRRIFLRRVFSTFPEAEYRHFGDIDCGGFRIWKNLCLATGIPFLPIHMGVEMLEKYGRYGRSLTGSDRKVLEEMLRDPFYRDQKAVLIYMKEHNIKLEQEIIREGEDSPYRSGS